MVEPSKYIRATKAKNCHTKNGRGKKIEIKLSSLMGHSNFFEHSLNYSSGPVSVYLKAVEL